MSLDIYPRFMPHTWISHATHMNQSCHTSAWHARIRLPSHSCNFFGVFHMMTVIDACEWVNEPWHAYERIMADIWEWCKTCVASQGTDMSCLAPLSCVASQGTDIAEIHGRHTHRQTSHSYPQAFPGDPCDQARLSAPPPAMRAITPSYTPWIIPVRAMTHSRVCNDPFTCVTWLIYVCGMSDDGKAKAKAFLWSLRRERRFRFVHRYLPFVQRVLLYVRHDSFIYVPWIIHFMCVLCIIHMTSMPRGTRRARKYHRFKCVFIIYT